MTCEEDSHDRYAQAFFAKPKTVDHGSEIEIAAVFIAEP